ncbi:c-type cytochrome [Alsobacter sp. R-9]
MGKPAAVWGLGVAALLGFLSSSVAGVAGGANGLAGTTAEPAQGAAQAPVRLAQAATGNRPVSWSDVQASRGEKLFKEVCADCHGASLRGGLIGGPPLTGSAFAQKFLNGTPASALFLFNSTLMPPDSPGQYSPGEYVDLTAFILRENGIDSSGAPMPTNPAALDHMIVEK